MKMAMRDLTAKALYTESGWNCGKWEELPSCIRGYWLRKADALGLFDVEPAKPEGVSRWVDGLFWGLLIGFVGTAVLASALQ